MIPQRVKLKGFLCYKDEQTIGFDGNATLWMLSGLNGSGKSAIFDAVTYALFGHHRGGGQHAHELINKDSDTLVVEFDFLLDGKLYRAKRTLKRDTKGGARGTQQMFRWEPGKTSQGKWEAIEGTGQKRPFDEWVKDNVGLEYETFTSSVLLLQGKAEKLLDSRPEGRREVLASIVDLDRYERLHQKADEKRKILEGELKSLTGRLGAVPAVPPLELAAARQRIAEAEELRGAARLEVERLQMLVHESRRWVDWQQRLAQARTRWQHARDVLGKAAVIEKKVERLNELRAVLPHIHEIVICRAQARKAREQKDDLATQLLKDKAILAERDSALRQARDKRSLLQAQITREEQQHREMSAQLRKLEGQLTRLAEYERQESDLERLRQELKKLPVDPSVEVLRAREAFERLEALSRVTPVLARFHARRQELRAAQTQAQMVEQQQQAVQERGKATKAELDAIRPRVEEAAGVLSAASDAFTEARTLLAQAREALAELNQLDGAKVCRHCGQQLTAGHVEDEKRRRSRAVQEAEARAARASEVLEVARASEQKRREELTALERSYQDARDAYRDGMNQIRQASLAVERLQQECANLHGELPEPFHTQIAPVAVADWATTTYPSAEEVQALQGALRGLDTARRARQHAEEVQQRWSQLKGRETMALETLQRLALNLPHDRNRLRADHSALEAHEKALFRTLDGCRAQVKEADREIERLAQERDQAHQAVVRTEGRITEQHMILTSNEHTLASKTKQLPANWHALAEKVGMNELHLLKGEQKQLEDEGTDELARDLEHARRHLETLEQDVEAVQKLGETFPVEARQAPEVVAARLVEARQTDQQRENDLSQAKANLTLLESYCKQREEIDEKCKGVEKELLTYRTLAELLGRERLQLYLVRQAERQVVEYANAVLDRLSGGQLYLKLSGEANGEGASGKALELEAFNRATGERPINVAFLSGSQKFRVAVSLALGIGQYASRQHRPIESVIIDEGFGCLDSQGRQVMIQELQNLRSQMRCILLVSHQEDFAESFSDGYHFQLENGATRVQRFQK